MKKKMQEYFLALQIISQIPTSEPKVQAVWDDAVDTFFGESLINLSLLESSYQYDDGRVGKNRRRHFVCTSGEDGFSVIINIYTDNGDRKISATALFDGQEEKIET